MLNPIRIISASCLFWLVALSATSQSLSINTDGSTANASALLDVKSTDKGILIPRMTKGQRNSIASPAIGLLVFQVAPDSLGFYYYTGINWLWLATANSTVAWSTTGNAGTDTAVNFLGTTTNMPIRFRQNNGWIGQFNRNQQNYFIGSGAGQGTTTGTGNTAYGDSALAANTTSSDNSAFGANTLKRNTSGFGNTAFGSQVLRSNTTGISNTAMGYGSLLANTTGYNNVAIGNALFANKTGNTNTAIGSNTLNNDTTGSGNTAIGFFAMFEHRAGDNNTAVGTNAMQYNRNGGGNVAIGNNAMQNDTASSFNVGIGANSLQNGKQTIFNVAVGFGTLANAGVGRLLVPPGSFDGDYNTAVGYNAGTSIKRGYSNTSIGAWAHVADTSGIGNTYVGTLSGTSQVAPAVSGNSGMGWFSLYSNKNGFQNSALGAFSGQNNFDGSNNVYIGTTSGIGNISGSGNTFLGAATDATANNLFNATAIGYQSEIAQSNSMVLGSIAGINGAGTTVSVGIGENSPNARLHIKRNGASGGGFHGSSSLIIEDNASSYLQFSNPAANETGLLSGSDLTTIRSAVIFRADSSLQLRTGGNSTRITIDNTGYTGIRTINPQSFLDVNGSTGSPIQTTSLNTTLDEFDHTLVITNIAGAITVTLPAASTCSRREYVIVNQDNGAKTITSYLDFTGVSSTAVPANGSITLQSNGTNWYRIR